MKRVAFISLALIGATTATAQQSIKPRPLGVVQATSKELLGSATLARALPNGSVIVNDAARRRLLLLDPSLQSYSVIADSTSGSANGYGQRPGALIPYIADSTLFLDATAGSFLVIDPTGKVARVMSPPRPADNFAMANTVAGFPGFDAGGRMVYRTNYPRVPQQLRDGSIQMSPAPDSAPLLRVDLDTRRADTVGAVKTPRTLAAAITMPGGGTATMMRNAPLATIDDWAILSDGTIAIVRGRDYHIDWIFPDGTRRSTEKVAFEWKRLSDDDKLAIIDSIAKAPAGGPGGIPGGTQTITFGGGDGMRMMMGGGGGGGGAVMATREFMVAGAAVAATPATPPAAPAPTPTPQGKPAEAKSADAKASATDSKNTTPATSANNAATPAPATNAMPGGAPSGFTMPSMPAFSASDLPDYMPPFTAASARADADANVWIRTTTPGLAAGGVVYDVINNKGQLVDRVDVPKGMSIVGFGRGGVVYLIEREGYGVRFLRATVR